MHSGDRLLRPEDWTYGKPRELLYLLAGSAPRTKEQFGVALWPGLPAGELRSAFHTALHQLRQALGGRGWVVYADGHYAFDRSRDYWYDVEAFESELLAARQAASPPAALPHLERALAVYTGDFLADMNAGEWVESRRAELRRAVESALLGAGRLLVAEKRYREAVDVYLRAVAGPPAGGRASGADALLGAGRRAGSGDPPLPGPDPATARRARRATGGRDHRSVLAAHEPLSGPRAPPAAVPPHAPTHFPKHLRHPPKQAIRSWSRWDRPGGSDRTTTRSER